MTEWNFTDSQMDGLMPSNESGALDKNSEPAMTGGGGEIDRGTTLLRGKVG